LISKTTNVEAEDLRTLLNFITNLSSQTLKFIPTPPVLTNPFLRDTNIPHEEGINIVCRQYESHYESKPPIPVTYLRELMRLILEENSFKFNERHFLQTHAIATAGN